MGSVIWSVFQGGYFSRQLRVLLRLCGGWLTFFMPKDWGSSISSYSFLRMSGKTCLIHSNLSRRSWLRIFVGVLRRHFAETGGGRVRTERRGRWLGRAWEGRCSGKTDVNQRENPRNGSE